jgi:GT2 family glycosyltransferase/Tfp pilus assembly protein PilF
MSPRYLFGPVTPEFANENLLDARNSGECLAFGDSPGTDLVIGMRDTWEMVRGRFPSGWEPDFVALYLPYTTIARCLWSAPVPLIGLAADWNLLWHGYRQVLKACDLALTDTGGTTAMAQEGLGHARVFNLFGCERSFLDLPTSAEARDIDVLFVGNLQPAVQRERLRWLGRLARLADHRRVEIHSGVFGSAYRDLLGRSRIVFNRSIRGECNRRVFEAATAGALLFQEEGNLEVPAYLQAGKEFVYYTADNLEDLLEYYLDNEDKRRAIAEAGRERARGFSFQALWRSFIESAAWRVETGQRAERLHKNEGFVGRLCQASSASRAGDPELVSDLATALIKDPRSAALHNALGVAVALEARSKGAPIEPAIQQAIGCFRRAIACDPDYVVAGLNLVEGLLVSGQRDAAIEEARRVVAALDQEKRLPWGAVDACHFPAGFDLFRVEWERAAWSHAGEPAAEWRAKQKLLRWRLHSLLGGLTDDCAHFYEAAIARPDLPSTRAALGCALAREGQMSQAAPHLRQAVQDNPFDLEASRALFQVLGQVGDGMGQRRLADQRRLLTKAAPQSVPVEPWNERVPPAGDELASIIVLCCNQLEYTRLCLEGVLRHTRAPYELLLVDNGSTDGTAAYLQEIRARVEPARVVVITNETNRGFAAGCNQALAQARGRYLVFLNNDTVVAQNWLSGLIAWAVHQWPSVGLVGPMSNYAPAPQYVAGDYHELSGLDPFAARWQQDHAGEAIEVQRLTGFCLLARREALERIGTFDEGYGLGFFEDDDLCVRVRAAGFRLLVARDVFIHHFGSRTFQGLGIDCRDELQKNFERFRAKWGDERVAGYRMPDRCGEPALIISPAQAPSPAPRAAMALAARITSASAAPHPRQTSAAPSEGSPGGHGPDIAVWPREQIGRQDCLPPRVSLCMIVKNEEANLAGCLLSAADLVDEVIVVDTGSTDATKAVAAKFGARVYDFAWVDNFATARNESLRHATGDWIFWMDADDRVNEQNRPKLRALFDTLTAENVAYVMKCRCLPDPQSGAATVVDHVRLFRNNPAIRWKYRVHEQILPAVRGLNGQVRATDIIIEHVGYVDRGLRNKKQERDIRLLKLDRADHPNDPFILFNLGWSLEELRRPAEALPLLRRSLELSQPSDSIVRKLYTLIMECHRQLGQPQEALGACERGRRFYPNDAQLLFQEALLRREVRDHAAAEGCLLRLLSTSEGPHFASVVEGLRGCKARHNLAVIYQEQGRFAEAEAQWKAALQEQEDFAPAWVGLGELYLAQGRLDELKEPLSHLESVGCPRGEGAVASAVLRARSHLVRGEFSASLHLLREALIHSPDSVWLWVVLSHALLQEGKDWDAAEAALRKVLELDPANAEANRNLRVLLARQQPKVAG